MCHLIGQLQVCEGKGKLEYCALLGYYAASGGNSLTTFRDDLSVPSSMLKNHGGTYKSSRNVSKEMPLLAA